INTHLLYSLAQQQDIHSPRESTFKLFSWKGVGGMSEREVQHFSVRCLAYPKVIEGQQGFLAVCIDLNLVTWRPTLTDAKRSWEEALVGYLETVAKLANEGEDYHSLLHRPAPFWAYRAMYYFFVLKRLFSRRPYKGGLRKQDQYLFDEPVD